MTALEVLRLPGNPIVHDALAGLEGEIGANVNGPSLVRVPDWLPQPLARYYLYFAHHHGDFIRLALADRVEGPWRIHPGGVLSLASTGAYDHIASPDVHVDHDLRQFRMYFHGCTAQGRAAPQVTFVAMSSDGLRFAARAEPLGPFYFRVFRHNGWTYALAKLADASGVLLRSRDGMTPFELGPTLLERMRHAAVTVREQVLDIVFSRHGDAPEHLLHTTLDLRGDWRDWQAAPPMPLLFPEREWEGTDQPLRPSRPGRAFGRERALRDPALLDDDGRTLLVYAVAGEQGLAIAELHKAT